MNTKLEVCAGCIESVKAAQRGGAYRVELCSGLDEGGVTPSVGFVEEALKLSGMHKNVLVRPRGGDFLYTEAEKSVICRDIERYSKMGVDGIVVGALTAEGDIDIAAMKMFMDAARGVEVTFHRAFDMCRDPREALEQIVDLGCTRLLTSGLASSAEIGVPMLRTLVMQAGDRLIIMPGSGVNENNVRKIVEETKVTEIHSSARSLQKSAMLYRQEGVGMGKSDVDEYSRMVTSVEKVRAIVNNLL